MARCPRCNSNIPDKSQFCLDCGAEGTHYKKPSESWVKKPSLDKALPFVVIFFMGLLLECFFVIIPAIESIQARSWVATPCVIKSGRVLFKSRNRGKSIYSVYMSFSYEFNKFKCTSNRYSLIDISGEHDSIQSIINSNPPGSKRVCYVNPKNPVEAVINRDIGGVTCFFGILFGAITFFGATGILQVLKSYMAK